MNAMQPSSDVSISSPLLSKMAHRRYLSRHRRSATCKKVKLCSVREALLSLKEIRHPCNRVYCFRRCNLSREIISKWSNKKTLLHSIYVIFLRRSIDPYSLHLDDSREIHEEGFVTDDSLSVHSPWCKAMWKRSEHPETRILMRMRSSNNCIKVANL